MQHQKHLGLPELMASFPYHLYKVVRPNQEEALKAVAEHRSVTIEAPTGEGKTAIGYTVLRATEKQGAKSLWLITPSKTVVGQIKEMFPSVKMALGRNEFPCGFYEKDKSKLTLQTKKGHTKYTADEVPCASLTTCPHRVSQETGEAHEKGAWRCPYLRQTYEAKGGGIVVSTMAFYLFTHLFGKFEAAEGLVVDEAHRLADVIRHCLSYEITDYHIARAVALLEKINAPEAALLEEFRKKMVHFIKRTPARSRTLLGDEEIRTLMGILERIDGQALAASITKAIQDVEVDVEDERETLKQLELMVRDLRRYIKSFEYALEKGDRKPLNYTYAYWTEEKRKNERTQYRLVVKCYYAVPAVKRLLAPTTVALSATIGDKDVFGYETGIKFPVVSLPSSFPSDNTALFMPTDTPNLAVKERQKRDLNKTLRLMLRGAKQYAKKGHRSLLIVVSNDERDKLVALAPEEGIEVVSYGNGVTAKDAAAAFKAGKGTALVGTEANYAEGLDLPKGIAPVIFYLRPGYPSPYDPLAVFEERRFRNQRWKLWNWRVMIKALQVRGRNVRSEKDIGAIFFMSQQFRRFVYGSLPEWLQLSYVGTLSFEECLVRGEKLLGVK